MTMRKTNCFRCYIFLSFFTPKSIYMILIVARKFSCVNIVYLAIFEIVKGVNNNKKIWHCVENPSKIFVSLCVCVFRARNIFAYMECFEKKKMCVCVEKGDYSFFPKHSSRYYNRSLDLFVYFQAHVNFFQTFFQSQNDLVFDIFWSRKYVHSFPSVILIPFLYNTNDEFNRLRYFSVIISPCIELVTIALWQKNKVHFHVIIVKRDSIFKTVFFGVNRRQNEYTFGK